VKPSILIVDDSMTVRMDLRETFESADFSVTVCETIAAARSALAQTTFSLVVLDVMLPDGDGVDFLREIKSATGSPAVPVMLLSDCAEVRHRVRGLQTGADDYVGKPYDAVYLLRRARQLLGQTGSESASSPAKLLIIDGSAASREKSRTLLENAGYRVVTAETSEEGLRMAVAIRPRLIIVDGSSPGGLDGFAVVRRLKEDLALRSIPSVLLVGSEERLGETRALEAGADTVLGKDLAADLLLAHIEKLLRSAKAPSRLPSAYPALPGPKKILAVDDSVTYLQALAGELRQDGYDVSLASSGEEALELLEVQPVDCILLDVLMPGLSGNETCVRIKGREEWRDIPLLMLTGREEHAAMIEGINAGADDYVLKSSDFEVLRARLRAQLRRKQFEDENRRIREELLRREVETAQARAALEVAEIRASMAAELERKNQELETFSYSVSHDLRAPLRAIDGFSQALEEDCGELLDETGRSHLQRIRAAVRRMGLLIDALLHLSRVSRTELRMSAVDLSALARSVAREFEERDPQRKVEFVIAGGIKARGDPTLLRAVLENLLGNAWKFTGKREDARIEFSVETNGGWPVYSVRDDGVGFDMKYAGKLFGPFQRLHGEAEFPGAGIGLATVQRVVRRHGGRVWAESALGRGTAIRFTLGGEEQNGKQDGPAGGGPPCAVAASPGGEADVRDGGDK
jgi:DNA-binding response OmpR family regulator